MSAAKHSNDSRSDVPEQWSVVEKIQDGPLGTAHAFRVVLLKSNLGHFSHGLVCVDCGLVERFTERQWRQHGQRVERSTVV